MNAARTVIVATILLGAPAMVQAQSAMSDHIGKADAYARSCPDMKLDHRRAAQLVGSEATHTPQRLSTLGRGRPGIARPGSPSAREDEPDRRSPAPSPIQPKPRPYAPDCARGWHEYGARGTVVRGLLTRG